MFTVQCNCGAVVEAVETQLSEPLKCGNCGVEIVCISAEPIDAAGAAADFDAALLVISGPARQGQWIRLGGCLPIDIGKQAVNQIMLVGNMVSRGHCRLVRLDFGPSRWQIEDKKSTNGLFVNGQRITSKELEDADLIRIGEYELRYQLSQLADDRIPVEEDHELALVEPIMAAVSLRAARPAPALAETIQTTGPSCPSCERRLGPTARICVECGVHIPSGRPLLTSEGLDTSIVYGNAETALKIISWLVWVTPLPIPLASAAYGKHKPYAIWSIAALTVLASLWFLVAVWGGNDSGSARSAMLWPPKIDFRRAADKAIDASPKLRSLAHPAREELSRDDLLDEVTQSLRGHVPQFHWWQLFTHALLHDPNSIIGFIMHLGGNMLFLMVFGTRVNAIIGNVATAIVYPLLAAASASVYLMTLSADQINPLLGASGAINGLAGMYLVLFPAHHVYCAMWLRFRLYLMFKIFVLRGFWVLLIYFAYDLIMVATGHLGHTAHWAHIGGFLVGAAVGVGLLVSRQFDCRNGDLLSVVLGKHAWPLIGKPNRFVRATVV